MISPQRCSGPARRPSSWSPGSTSSGPPEAYNHYAVGWAHAMDTPYQWTKQVASHWGGTRNGTIVHWPGGIDGPRRGPQPVPPRHRRRADRPRGGRPAGADLRPRRPAAPLRRRQHGLQLRRRRTRAERHETQYFEMFCNRGIYHRGLDRGHPALDALGVRLPAAGVRGRHLGALRARRLDPGARPRRPSSPSSCAACSSCSCSRRASTTCSRSTTDGSSGSTPTSPAGRPWSTATPSCCSGAWAGSPRTPC